MKMKFHPGPWLLILAAFAAAYIARFQLIEQAEFGFYCDAGGQDFLCHLRWIIIRGFNSYGLGYAGLFLGAVAALSRSGTMGLAAAILGAAGLFLYTWDYSAVGFLLGVLTLARAQLTDYRHQHGTGHQPT